MEPTLKENLPAPDLERNDTKARILIWISFHCCIYSVALLSKVKLHIKLGFNPHIFAAINAVINSIVTILLIAGLYAVKSKKFFLHKKIMLAAIILSLLFLLSYICHHLLSGDTKYGDLDHDGYCKCRRAGPGRISRYIYYFILATHIPLAGIILPFILFTAYRALTGDYGRHMKLARITWPIWLYVAVTGVIVYWMIRPYYS